MNPLTRLNYKKMVSTLISMLPEEQKRILSLYYIEELTIKEIAIILDKPEQYVQDEYQTAVQQSVK